MNRLFPRILALALRAAAAAGLATVLGSCGSGAVSAPPVTPTPTDITVLPATATLYSGLPTTFSIQGGTAPYIVLSSNQAVVPVAGALETSTFNVVPASVAADTTVTLTVRDILGTQATATLTVKPRTINNVVSITPSATQPSTCGTSVCSGGDAEVNAKLDQNGVPLSNRQVRFDVVSGDFRLITSPPGSPEALALTAITSTDTTGSARIRIRALNDATAQTALLQITDLEGGNTHRVSFTIAPLNAVAVSALPSALRFVGPSTTACSSGASADVIVFGGRPPYIVTQPGGFIVSPTTLTASGQRFTVQSTGACSPDQGISIIDANNASASVTVSNVVGSVVASAPFSVTPTTVTFSNCTDTATVTLVGGVGTTYTASTTSQFLTATVAAGTNIGSIARKHPDAPPGNDPTPPPLSATSTSQTVTFSDGRSTAPVTVILTGDAAQTCL